jgi:N-acetyl-gamma-glutamyl-phosphate reductase
VKPFVDAKIIDEKDCVVVDGASGTSGAGRKATDVTHHSLVNENFTAYGLLDHRHTPEMEQVIGRQIIFTPHLLPMTRGILVTCYVKTNRKVTTGDLLSLQRDYYDNEPFVDVIDGIPSTKDCYGSNMARITSRYDERTGYMVMLAAIDNLTKGGAGQALQSANIALGIEESMGLTQIGMIP